VRRRVKTAKRRVMRELSSTHALLERRGGRRHTSTKTGHFIEVRNQSTRGRRKENRRGKKKGHFDPSLGRGVGLND